MLAYMPLIIIIIILLLAGGIYYLKIQSSKVTHETFNEALGEFDKLMNDFGVLSETIDFLVPKNNTAEDINDALNIVDNVDSTMPVKEYVVTDQGKNNFTAYEDKKCSFVANKLGNDAYKFDVIKNHILVNSGREQNECYIKGDNVLIQGNCNRQNQDLYLKKYNGVIDDIYPQLFKDEYVSKTVPQNACVLKFSRGDLSKQDLETYLAFLDNNLPKLKNYREQIVNTMKQVKVILNEKVVAQEKIKEQVTMMDTQNKVISENKNVLAGYDKQISDKVKEKENLEAKLLEKESKYKDRAKLYVTVCEHRDYLNCHKFPIGKYNVRQMSLAGLANDTMSSFKVPEGLSVKFYNETLDTNGNIVDEVNSKYIEKKGKYEQPWILDEKWNDGTQTPSPQDNVSSIIVTAEKIQD